jgi:hypothetical protein
MLRTTSLLFALAWAGSAHAQQLTYSFDDEALAEAGIDGAQLEADLDGALAGAFDFSSQQAWLDQMAAAAAIANKGTGVDYATFPKRVMFGGSLGAGTAGAGASFGAKADDGAVVPLPENGVSVQISLMAGLNLGILSPGENALDRFRIYVNGMSAPLPNGSPFSGNMYNVGAHLQIKLIGQPNPPKIGWGGLDLTSGYEHSTYKLSLSESLPIGETMGDTKLTWNATGDFSIQADAQSIPVELSTSVRLGVAALWLGGALDVNTASANQAISLGGPIEAGVGGQTLNVGTARLTLNGDGTADGPTPRVFGGVQANLLMVKIYGQLNVGFNDSFGGHTGIRIVL